MTTNAHKSTRPATLKSAVFDRLPHVSLIANVDVQGVRSFRAAAQTLPLLAEKMVTIFVAPDSLDVLRDRLQGRGPVSDDELARRRQRSARAVKVVPENAAVL